MGTGGRSRREGPAAAPGGPCLPRGPAAAFSPPSRLSGRVSRRPAGGGDAVLQRPSEGEAPVAVGGPAAAVPSQPAVLPGTPHGKHLAGGV